MDILESHLLPRREDFGKDPLGYPWTVIRMGRRSQYMAALEEASTTGRISTLARFISEEMEQVPQ